MTEEATLAIMLLSTIALLIILSRCIVIVKPWEKAVYLNHGKYVRMLEQGISIVKPFARDIVRIDSRPQKFNLNSPVIYTQDGRKIECEIAVNLRVSDAKKAFFEVTNYRSATMKRASDEMQRIISSMQYDDVARSLNLIEGKIEHSLSRTDQDYGIKVNQVELRVTGMVSHPCPKCGRASPIGFSHCGHCGVAISVNGAKSTRVESVAITDENGSSPHKIAEPYVPDNLKPPYTVERGLAALRKKRRTQ